MRKILTIGILLAIGLPIHGQQQSHQPSGDKNHADGAQNPLPPPPLVNCVVKQEPSTIQCNYSAANPPSYFSRLGAPENLPNLLLFLVGAGGIGIATITLIVIRRQTYEMAYQRIIMRHSLSAMRAQSDLIKTQMEHVISKERPRLSMEIKSFELGEVPVINYELTCHGTTPAYVQSSWESATLLPVPDFGWSKDAVYGFPLRGLPEVIPNKTIEGYVFIMDTCRDPRYLTQAAREAGINNGELWIIFRVRIVFKDIFDEKREHEYVLSKVYGLKRMKIKSDDLVSKGMLGWNISLSPEWADSAYKYGEYEQKSED